MSDKIVNFIRKKPFILSRELGKGSCGETVLLYDDIINENFVCKKYSPLDDSYKQLLFKNFVNEIKLLHLIYHKNIVRVFNYYLYPDILTGYIVMEYVKGLDIEEYIKKYPEYINEIFEQIIEGFYYLEINNILHRDIRVQNILINEEGIVKIIDFGFGKQIKSEHDFNKTFSLNLWCTMPQEFESKQYTFTTEIYFIGMLFKKIITDNLIEEFQYSSELTLMIQFKPTERIKSFYDIIMSIRKEKFLEINFSDEERIDYLEFSDSLSSLIGSIEKDTKYYDDIDKIKINLENLYKNVMLEEFIANNQKLINCFINGAYKYRASSGFRVYTLKIFLKILRSCNKEKQNIILSNLQFKLDGIKRFKEEIPF